MIMIYNMHSFLDILSPHNKENSQKNQMFHFSFFYLHYILFSRSVSYSWSDFFFITLKNNCPRLLDLHLVSSDDLH